MDKVLCGLKCENYGEILLAPVLLPCGHMICQQHTQLAEDQVMCSEWGIHHPNRDFVLVKRVADMIEAKLDR